MGKGFKGKTELQFGGLAGLLKTLSMGLASGQIPQHALQPRKADPAKLFLSRTLRLLKKHNSLTPELEKAVNVVAPIPPLRKAVMLATDFYAYLTNDAEAVKRLPLILRRTERFLFLQTAKAQLFGQIQLKLPPPFKLVKRLLKGLTEDMSEQELEQKWQEFMEWVRKRAELAEKRKTAKALSVLLGKKLSSKEAEELMRKLDSGDIETTKQLVGKLLGISPEELEKEISAIQKQLEEEERKLLQQQKQRDLPSDGKTPTSKGETHEQ